MSASPVAPAPFPAVAARPDPRAEAFPPVRYVGRGYGIVLTRGRHVHNDDAMWKAVRRKMGDGYAISDSRGSFRTKRRDRYDGNSGQTEEPTRAQRFGKGLTDEGDEHCAACVRCISREFWGGRPLPGGAAAPAAGRRGRSRWLGEFGRAAAWVWHGPGDRRASACVAHRAK